MVGKKQKKHQCRGSLKINIYEGISIEFWSIWIYFIDLFNQVFSSEILCSIFRLASAQHLNLFVS